MAWVRPLPPHTPSFFLIIIIFFSFIKCYSVFINYEDGLTGEFGLRWH